MSFLQDIFSEQFIYSLGWTLLHSLWQGVLIGLIISIAMIFLHKYSARLRYFINSIGLFAVAAFAVITFVASYTSYNPEPGYIPEFAAITAESGIQISSSESPAEESMNLEALLNTIADYARDYFPLFTGIWILGMFAMMLRFLGGYALVRRYKHHRVKPVMGEWNRKFKELARSIGVNQKVRLLESALVRIPVAIGYFKPVVLIPLGALNGVPAMQMEAILVHELAHIRRRDYLVNMIQSLLEVVFFYHPVVWWLSGNIRIERENICDDIAITQTGNTMEFAKALTNIQEINLGSPALAAGLSGKNKNRLLNRIRRINGKPRVQSGFAEGFIAASILMISLIGLSAAAMISNPTNYELPNSLNFEEVGGILPDINYYRVATIAPDTTEKAKQAQQQHQEQLEDEKAIQEAMQAHQKEIQEAIELEMQALKEKMRALDEEIETYIESEEYQEAFQKAMQSREAYMEQMHAVMEAYREAMNESHIHYRGNSWSLPQMYFKDGKTYRYDGDSSVWHLYAPNYHCFGDSLHEVYIDTWSDNWEDAWKAYENAHVLHEGKLLEVYAELEEMDELMEVAELEALAEHDLHYDFDYEYDYDFDYDRGSNFFMPGSMERIVQEELYEDDLIERGREYIVLIGKKQMLINGEKQARSVFKKYRRLIDSMNDTWLFDDNEEVSIRIGR